MLKVIVPMGDEVYDEIKNEFYVADTYTLTLEHSLASLSKWESQYEKPFLGKDAKTTEETFAYIHAMNLGDPIPDEVFDKLTNANVQSINAYLESKQTATWFNENPNQPRSREVITAEIIYYWLVALQIPFECQYWHLNRLLTLVKVINNKNQPPKKKMGKAELAAQNRQLNAQRRAQYGTRG